MTGWQLHDFTTEDIVGSVVITKKATEVEHSTDTLEEAWESFNKKEEYEGNTKDVDEFVEWFNKNYATQIERLYLEFIQHK